MNRRMMERIDGLCRRIESLLKGYRSPDIKKELEALRCETDNAIERIEKLYTLNDEMLGCAADLSDDIVRVSHRIDSLLNTLNEKETKR